MVAAMTRATKLVQALEAKNIDQVVEVLADAFPNGLWIVEEERVEWRDQPDGPWSEGYIMGDELVGVNILTKDYVELVSYNESTGKTFHVELYPEHLPPEGPVTFYKEGLSANPIPNVSGVKLHRRHRISSDPAPGFEDAGELRLDLSHVYWDDGET